MQFGMDLHSVWEDIDKDKLITEGTFHPWRNSLLALGGKRKRGGRIRIHRCKERQWMFSSKKAVLDR